MSCSLDDRTQQSMPVVPMPKQTPSLDCLAPVSQALRSIFSEVELQLLDDEPVREEEAPILPGAIPEPESGSSS